MRIEPAFADRERVWEIVTSQSPYRLMPGFVSHQGHAVPWFLWTWPVPDPYDVPGLVEHVLCNDRFIDAAATLFDAAVVHPIAVTVNFNLPSALAWTHTDPCMFRQEVGFGLAALSTPMANSGLFTRWHVRNAKALSWFYDGDDGHYEYWPDGQDAPSHLERAPFGNVAILADHDFMPHRAQPVGRPDRYLPAGAVTLESTLTHDPVGSWTVVEDGEVRMTYAADEMRICVVWHATVFDNQDDADRFLTNTDTITVDEITQIFADDLRERGIPYDNPADPLHDETWLQTLNTIYGAPVWT